MMADGEWRMAEIQLLRQLTQVKSRKPGFRVDAFEWAPRCSSGKRKTVR
jgi:hypothetical protein